jgi:hypothetical protein
VSTLDLVCTATIHFQLTIVCRFHVVYPNRSVAQNANVDG